MPINWNAVSRCDQTRLESRTRPGQQLTLMAFGSNDLLLEDTPSSFGKPSLLSLDTNPISEPSSPPTTEHVLTPSQIEEDEEPDSPKSESIPGLKHTVDATNGSMFQSSGILGGCDFGTPKCLDYKRHLTGL